MAYLLPSNLRNAIPPCKKTRFSQCLQVKAQSYRDHQGRSSNIVDENLHLLKLRIKEVKNKDRLERCCLAEQGWNYAAVQSYRSKREEEMFQFLHLVGVVGGTFGLTILSCSFCLCIISLVLHLNQ